MLRKLKLTYSSMTGLLMLLGVAASLGSCSLVELPTVTPASAAGNEVVMPAFDTIGVSRAVEAADAARTWLVAKPPASLEQQADPRSWPTLSHARKAPATAADMPSFAKFPPFARQVYVGPDGSDISGGDSPERPLRSIQAALREARALGPGTEIIVRGGRYDEGSISLDFNGTADGWVALRGYPGERPVITGTPWQLVHIRGSYVLFEGFEVDGNRVGRTMEDGTELASPADLHAWASKLATCLPTGENCGSGVYVEGAGNRGIHHIVVRDIVAHSFPGGGISSNAADFLVLEDNIAFGNGHYSYFGHSGISMFQPNPVGSSDKSPYRIIIRRNASFSNHQFSPSIAIGQNYTTDGNGIIVDLTSQYKYPYRVLIANNLVFNNGGSGIHAFHSAHVDIVNNTSYLNSTHPRLKGGEIFPVDAQDINIYNNILYGGGEGNFLNVMARSKNVAAGGNILFGPGKPEIVGKTDIKADPGLIAPSSDPAVANFALQATSPGIGRSDRSFVVEDDYLGRKRPAAADIGAIQSR